MGNEHREKIKQIYAQTDKILEDTLSQQTNTINQTINRDNNNGDDDEIIEDELKRSFEI